MSLFICLTSAILYRLRGSDDVPIESLQIKRIIFAAITASLILPNVWGLGLFVWLWMSVTFVEKADADWGPQPESRYGFDPFMLFAFGLLAFNPLFGVVHQLTYKINDKLPKLPYLKGHAEWSEFINGALTAAGAMLSIWGVQNYILNGG